MFKACAWFWRFLRRRAALAGVRLCMRKCMRKGQSVHMRKSHIRSRHRIATIA